MSSKYLIDQYLQQKEIERLRFARIVTDFLNFRKTDDFRNAIANAGAQNANKTIKELFIKAHPEYDAESIELVRTSIPE